MGERSAEKWTDAPFSWWTGLKGSPVLAHPSRLLFGSSWSG